MRSVGVVGNGVVGSATGKAFASKGFEVRYWDLKPDRTTHSLKDVLLGTEAVFVCLPTPAYPDGSCDVSILDEFFTNGPFNSRERSATFVIRSTVPVGFTRRMSEHHKIPHLYHWPEFVNAATADREMIYPRCLILGRAKVTTSTVEPLVNLLGDAFHWNMRVMSSDESEAVKLLMNAWLSIKNAAFNEFRLFADALGLDWQKVVGGMLAEGRLHPVQTQVPGPDGKRGFGGACLPKDLSSFVHQSLFLHDMPSMMAMAARAVNERVRDKPV